MAPRRYAQVAITALLLIGCAFVLSPFFAAILFAGTVCITTWPMYAWLHRKLKRRDSLAALTMTLVLTAVLLVPMIGLAASLTDAVTNAVNWAKDAIEQLDGRPPAWVRDIPLVGHDVDAYVRKLTHSQQEMRKVGQLETGSERVGGALGRRLLDLAANTVKAVMIGIVGTAAAQALVALVGFLIAGVPGALLLAHRARPLPRHA